MKNAKSKIVILGAGGFIGGHLAKRLHEQGHKVRGVDLKYNKFQDLSGIEFIIGDLRDTTVAETVIDYDTDEVYQLACMMGGAGFIFTGDNDADIIHNDALINGNVAMACVKKRVKKVFFSSSACAYSQDYQHENSPSKLDESMAYPANPDSVYGFAKLFSELVYQSFARNYGLNIRIARFHNIFGPAGSFYDGKEKAPAAMVRKAIMTPDAGTINIWGSGKQVRTFLYIEDCLDAVQLLMKSDFTEPINIGSEQFVSIEDLAQLAINISGKSLSINHIEGPTGVAGRCSDNTLINKVLGWDPKITLTDGMTRLYKWMKNELSNMPVVYESSNGERRSFVTEYDIEGKTHRYRLDV